MARSLHNTLRASPTTSENLLVSSSTTSFGRPGNTYPLRDPRVLIVWRTHVMVLPAPPLCLSPSLRLLGSLLALLLVSCLRDHVCACGSESVVAESWRCHRCAPRLACFLNASSWTGFAALSLSVVKVCRFERQLCSFQSSSYNSLEVEAPSRRGLYPSSQCRGWWDASS